MKAAEVLQAIEGLEPAAQRAYLAQIEQSMDSVSLAEVERAIESGDESAVVTAAKFGIFAVLIEHLRTVYVKGAQTEAAGIKVKGISKEMDFHAAGPAGFMAAQASRLVAQVEADQAAVVRVVLSSGSAKGMSARQMALELIGRVSKQTGRRTGGVIGLSEGYAERVSLARTQLLSGDKAMLRQYLLRSRRDRRFDPTVKASIKSGKPLDEETVSRIVGRYADRLLATQAELVAQMFVTESFNQGRDQAWRQVVARTDGRFSFVKTWKSRGDNIVRGSHRVMNNQVVDKDAPFMSPRGALLMFPGDSSLGAPIEERARCRCIAEYSIVKLRI
ncbi:hypothetical protein B1F77_26910 [Pseudomonas syringae]|uniref:Phage Mu protein F like protein n=1 Tax=Pseudomonas syringae TaxID=317 RepID=A0AB37ZS13_PSESX|nr:hypothetical protein [Pseudomonas syringae]RXT72251.1 hypothetical protein B1F77_26910 [Pseudomonas syringae]RXT85335.1 hypothetical protein B1F72_13800 [Pseudomonas syringae]SDN47339.1 hypothetical protein SAMN05444505_108179 [Pseudomonas syringae]